MFVMSESFWNGIGIGAAVLTMFGFLPQVIKIFHTKSASDVSLLTLIQFFLGIFLWILYGIHLKNLIMIVANVVTLVCIITVLILYFRYRRSAPL